MFEINNLSGYLFERSYVIPIALFVRKYVIPKKIFVRKFLISRRQTARAFGIVHISIYTISSTLQLFKSYSPALRPLFGETFHIIHLCGTGNYCGIPDQITG